MADRDFMGVSESALLAVGKVTVAAGLLEEVAQDIDHALGGTPGGQQFKNVIREIRERLTNSLPPHARAETSDIYRWTERAISAMDARHRWAHSAYKKIYRAGAWESTAQHIRFGRHSEIDEKAEKHADQLRVLAHEGVEQQITLLPEIRKGIYLRQPRNEGEPWFIGRYLEDEGRYAERLTDQELDEVREQYVIRPGHGGSHR
jgi:hypothetical protein